jgi:hypothetical protein
MFVYHYHLRPNRELQATIDLATGVVYSSDFSYYKHGRSYGSYQLSQESPRVYSSVLITRNGTYSMNLVYRRLPTGNVKP